MDTIFVVSREGEMLYSLFHGGIYTTFLCRRKGYHKARNTICCVTGKIGNVFVVAWERYVPYLLCDWKDRYHICRGNSYILLLLIAFI